MSATKYQVLYRYINETTNTPITNSDEYEYEPVREFYVDLGDNTGHQIFIEEFKGIAIGEQQKLITEGNSVDNIKNNMLFAYDGTKKIFHSKWIKDQPGYIVKDWKLLNRDDIGNRGDYSKKFTTLGASTPEDGGTVVCNAEVLEYLLPNLFTNDGQKIDLRYDSFKTGYEYTEKEVYELIYDKVNFNLKDTLDAYTYAKKSTKQRISTNRYFSRDVTEVYIGPYSIGGKSIIKKYAPNTIYTKYDTINSTEFKYSLSEEGLYSGIAIKKDHIETLTIPGHYEEQIEAPYLIIDTYKKIKLSPWFVSCQCSSLESALTKAENLIKTIGIENVKIIKLVPFEQNVKIK